MLQNKKDSRDYLMKDLNSKDLLSIFRKLPMPYRKQVISWRRRNASGTLKQDILDAFVKNGIQGLLFKQENVAPQKKNEIIQIALSGESRPGQKTHRLGKVFGQYIDPKSTSYDEAFDAKIRQIRPDWFEGMGRRSPDIKFKLLELASNKQPRPEKKSTLGKALARYTSGKLLDIDLKNKLLSLVPEWFRINKDVCYRTEILALAQDGKNKPYWNTAIGKALIRYTNKSQNGYDEEFNIKIRQMRPDWFIRSERFRK